MAGVAMVGGADGARGSTGDRPSHLARWSVLGGGLLLAALGLGTPLRGEGLSAVSLALLLAVAVVVPLGLALVPPPAAPGLAPSIYRAATLLQPPAALLAVVAFLLPVGRAAGAFALGWLALTAIVACYGLARFLAHRFARAEEVAIDAGLIMLPVGGGWLICSRAGLQPGGFSEPIIALTAAHFHYAAFGALLLAGLVGRHLPPGRAAARALYRPIVAGIVAGIPLVALAISDLLPEPPGALLLTVSLLGLSGLIATLLPRLRHPAARALLIVSALAPLLSMTLACGYALREQYPALALPIAQMVRFHGLVNALCLILCGLLAWTIEERAAPAPR